MPIGHLALVLHAHLPFVRHPEHDEFFEEDWLFEAITESYIPLLNALERLTRDRVPCRLAMSITPPLCAMLQDELLRSRYVRYLDRSISLAERELARTRDEPNVHQLARFYFELLSETRRQFEEWNRDLLSRFRHFRDVGALEIIASAATHGLLPLLAQDPAAVRAQVRIGCDVYREVFAAEPAGFWLPECAYMPGLEHVLQEVNIRWFVLDAHGLMLGNPRPRRAIYAPCFTPAGPAAFARDPESSRQVWSAESGYPGDPAYREFHRDIGFDLPPAYISPESPSRSSGFTGLKYHRITGRDVAKEIYNPAWAEAAANAHAEHFLVSRRQQIQTVGDDFEPVLTMPFDAELFGHWWFEGPRFLELLIRKVAHFGDELRLTTPGEYLHAHATQEVVEPAASSWGKDGYWAVWLHESNSWIHPHLHSAAVRMTEAARKYATHETTDLIERMLKQLARELLLAQSSDWAFLMHSGTATQYATKRTKEHIRRFNALCDQLDTGAIDEALLSECEARDNLFPDVDWRYYL
ncbi:MAG: glycoside hydrolase family 57 protein [Chthoniobacterales bacterium]